MNSYEYRKFQFHGSWRIRLFILGALLGASLAGSYAYHKHVTRACLTDEKIAEILRGDND